MCIFPFIGLHTHSEQSFVKSYKVHYRDLLTGTLEKYLYNGSDEVRSYFIETISCPQFIKENDCMLTLNRIVVGS